MRAVLVLLCLAALLGPGLATVSDCQRAVPGCTSNGCERRDLLCLAVVEFICMPCMWSLSNMKSQEPRLSLIECVLRAHI